MQYPLHHNVETVSDQLDHNVCRKKPGPLELEAYSGLKTFNYLVHICTTFEHDQKWPSFCTLLSLV